MFMQYKLSLSFLLLLSVIQAGAQVIVKDKKQLKGLKTNLIISLLRIILLVFTMIPFFMDDILIMGMNFICSLSLMVLIYFIISCIIEFGIDFVIKKCQKPNS